MSKKILLSIVLFLLTFSLPSDIFAQSGFCGQAFQTCNAINATCESPLILNQDGCNDESIPNCSDREWFCEMPSGSCTYNTAFGTCMSNSCGEGQENTYNCSQHNGDEIGCNTTPSLVCEETNQVCEWRGATSCEPAISCGDGTITNPEINDLCHDQNFETCSTITHDTIGSTEICIEPDGWYCLPNSGTASNCAACFGSDCDDRDLIPYVQCSVCNRGGEAPFIFCNEDGVATNDAGPAWDPNPLYTAVGCIPVAQFGETTRILLIMGLSVGGGLSLLLMGIAGILIKFSAGNPQRLQAGKELITAAIAGLMLIIFSAYILRVLGVEILGIPSIGL